MRLTLLLLMLISFGTYAAASDCSDILNTGSAQSSWVSVNTNQELVYRNTPAGDRVMDFSYAGYGGGGVALPNVPVVVTVTPSGRDDTNAIQAAINQVSAMPLIRGFRGAVQLAPGSFSTSSALHILASGVVLRGSGSGSNGTLVNLVGDPHTFIKLGKSIKPKLAGKHVRITDAYVPSGAMQIHVSDVKLFHVGEQVMIIRPVTKAWVQFLGMDNLCDRCDWLSTNRKAEYDRVIKAIDRSRKLIMLDAPIPDSLDSRYLQPEGATIVRSETGDRLQQVGVEHIHVVAPQPYPIPVQFTSNPQFMMVLISGSANAWANDLIGENFLTGVEVNDFSKWVTVQDVSFINNPPSSSHGAKYFQYYISNAQLVLLNRCTAGGANIYSYTTGALTSGPNVILNSTENDNSYLEPHMRWATGLLVDGFTADQGGIDFMSRGRMGSGHGWTMAWGVIWNSAADTFRLQQPPGTYVWAIGNTGVIVPPHFPTGGPATGRDIPNEFPATIESFGMPVSPKSLYLAQLCVRKGRAAVASLGY